MTTTLTNEKKEKIEVYHEMVIKEAYLFYL